MMDDQLRDALLEIAEEQGYTIESRDEFLIGFYLDDTKIVLEFENPESFPYEVPSFGFHGEIPEKLKGRPHIGATGWLCSFDGAKVRANPMNPYMLFVEALGKARSTLESSYYGTNDEDFFDEFKFYWMHEQELQEEFSAALVCFAEVGSECVELVAGKSPNTNTVYFVDNTKEHLRKCLPGLPDDDDEFFKCLFIPLNEEFTYPFPSTRSEWRAAFHEKSAYGEKYDRFLRKNGGEASFVMFSQSAKNGRVLAGIVYNFNSLNPQAAIKKDILRLYNNLDGLSGNEYRKKVLSFSKEMTAGKVVRVGVTEVDSNRLVNRGGLGKYSRLERAAVIGCGSLGGYLADALARSGVPELSLVDYDRIETDNFARHLCGLRSLYKQKVIAVASRIRDNIPSLVVHTHYEDIHKLLSEQPCFLEEEKPEAVFLATGTFSTELHVINVLKERNVDSSVVSIWVEPYGVAGHAIVINNLHNLASLPFTSTLTDTDSIVLNADELTRREAGCVSTYMPYSGSDALIFVNTFLKVYAEKMHDEGNYCFDWYGGISAASEYPVKLAEGAFSKRDYSYEIRKL